MKFLAGKNKKEVPAQRNVLFAKSHKLKMELDGRKDGTIDLTNFSAGSVKAFVKAVFLDCLDSEAAAHLDLNNLVEVYSLVVKYEILNLKNGITSILTKKITSANCIRVLQDPEFNQLPEEIRKTAWRFFKWNLPSLLAETDIPSSFMYWNKETWAKVLSLEGIENFLSELNEELLFLQFLQWKTLNPNLSLTEDDVNELVRLIRFPLMTEGFLSSGVENSGLLSDSDLLDLVLYTKDDNKSGRIPSFDRSQRSYKLVKAPKDLEAHLCGSQPGDCINLEGTMEFDSYFKNNLKKVTIKGRNGMDAKKLKFCISPDSSPNTNGGDGIFYLKGDDLTIMNLEFIASDPRIRWEVVIDGKRNVPSNLKFHGCALRTRGKSNRIKDISFVGDAGGKPDHVFIIDIDQKDGEQQSGWNTVNGITFVNVTKKIFVHEKSLNNKIQI